MAGCLRNCEAVAHFAQSYGSRISVIPAGERWEDGSLRPAIEDLVGAGAILSYLEGRLSPEAEAAMAVFHGLKDNLVTALRGCTCEQTSKNSANCSFDFPSLWWSQPNGEGSFISAGVSRR